MDTIIDIELRSRADPARPSKVGARRHDLNANQLFTRRRQFGVELTGLKDLAPILPVTIALETTAENSEPALTLKWRSCLLEATG